MCLIISEHALLLAGKSPFPSFCLCFWQTFHDPLMEAGVLTEQEAQHIFVNWNDLIICNKKFLQYVSGRCAAHFLLDRLVRGKGRICLHRVCGFCQPVLEWIGQTDLIQRSIGQLRGHRFDKFETGLSKH